MTAAARRVREPATNTEAETFRQSYVTAILLTGSCAIAEAAVLKAIEDGSESLDSGQPLLCRTVNASLRMPGAMRMSRADELEMASNAVSDKMRAVIALPLLLRQCFVLRILLALPSRECALLLNISNVEVGRYSGEAAASIASWRNNDSQHLLHV